VSDLPLTSADDLAKQDAERSPRRPVGMGKDSLKISELFYSLQGESTTSGLPTVFVRLTGCPLRCSYCDSEYSFYGGDWRSFADIEQQVASYGGKNVCVGGGEHLAQRACLPFLSRLCDTGYSVSLETAGALDVSKVDPRVVKVMDLKTPASNEAGRNKYENIDYLTEQDQVKFVICNRGDYDWAVQTIAQFELLEKCEVLMSSSYEQLAPRDLADWIVADSLQVRFQLQVHKYLWGDIPGV